LPLIVFLLTLTIENVEGHVTMLVFQAGGLTRCVGGGASVLFNTGGLARSVVVEGYCRKVFPCGLELRTLRILAVRFNQLSCETDVRDMVAQIRWWFFLCLLAGHP